MDVVKRFTELGIKDVSVAGGKGASLGELSKIGIPIPDGFVVSAQVFDKFLELTQTVGVIRATLDGLESENLDAIEVASAKIQSMIMSAQFPSEWIEEIMSAFKDAGMQFVAVRSSATEEDGENSSWAGELESFLYTPRAELIEAIKKCWASAFTSRVLLYRIKRNIRKARGR